MLTTPAEALESEYTDRFIVETEKFLSAGLACEL